MAPTDSDLPEGTDPADLIKAGEYDRLRVAIMGARPMVHVVIDHLATHDLAYVVGRVRTLRADGAPQPQL
jgi:hypothetical protein